MDAPAPAPDPMLAAYPCAALAVQPWPGPLQLSSEGVLVLGLRLTSSATGGARAQARLAVRHALTQAMATLLHHPPASIHIDNRRGHAPQISIADGHGPAPQCSFAYTDRYALAALNLHGAIGVDLTPVIDIPDWQAVARDYLGPQVCARLQTLPAGQRAPALAQEWCQLEAQLKCRGVALSEWREECHADARHAPLILPHAGIAGHVAWH